MRKQNRNGITDLSRRAALKAAAVAGGVVVLPALLAACGGTGTPAAVGGSGAEGTVTVDTSLPENKALAAVGGTLALDANAVDPAGLLLVRTGEAEVAVFSRACTHLGCPVAAFDQGQSNCPCHGSVFDTSGQPVKGPASKPLKKYAATVNGTEIVISNAG